RLSGRGMREKEDQLGAAVKRYGDAARALTSRATSLPEGSDLRQKLAELEKVPAPEARDAWSEELKRRIDRLRTAAAAFQSAADEQLYKSNAAVRDACEKLAAASRIDLARAALLNPESGLVARLGSKVPVVGFAMNGNLSEIALTGNGRPAASLPLNAGANASDLAGAVASVAGGMSGRPARAIVLLSDGRQVGGRGDVTSAVRPSGVPVFTVGCAAPRTPDVSIVSASLPASVFSGETIEGEVTVRDEGGMRAPTEVHVVTPSGDQVEKLTPRARADRRQQGREWGARFDLQIKPNQGQAAQRVVFSVPPLANEATAENNQIERWLKISSDQLKVALCTAAPTWDFQYLRGVLSRRPWVLLDTHLLDPQRPRLAMTPQQILDQDVLVLDDVPVTGLNVNQWDAVRSLITSRGGSVIVIGGTSFPVTDYAHQPIAKTLLPFHDVRPTWKQWPGEQPAFHFTPTPLGLREAMGTGGNADAEVRRWQELPGVYRYLQIPEKSLLPDVRPLLVEADGHSPVLTERRVGAGRVYFLGLDETWRWRFKVNDREADQFWRQLIRHAAGEPYAASQGPLALDLDKVAIRPGEAVRLRARLRGSKTPSPAAASCPVLVIRDGKTIATRALASAGGGHFAGRITDLPQGDYQIELRGTTANGQPQAVRVPLHVADSDEAEMSDVSGDPAMLTRIARASGGQYLPVEQVDRLAERLNALHETESQFVRRPIWNSPLFFAFVLACFTGEWALRKRLGLA
ncbi:MAG TPA: hypothetical protein VLJ39_14815, partial [Tepidisphaeraceae bacterium]|nr:hypothetical protein [Tepidisphaeraceae bacterium]